MKKILLILSLSPLLSKGQKTLPRFENDTLYAKCGYKIYKGQTLYFSTPTGNNGKFRYVNIKSDIASSKLANNSIVVKKLKNFGISVLGNAYIEIIGSLVFKDGSKGFIDIHMAFDHAIESLAGLPGELIVPAAFQCNRIAE